jgi:Holliday junction DNA helicase RuvA
MIAFLKGNIEEKKSDHVLIDVQGVGYKVEASTQTLDQLKEKTDVKLLIHHHITENDQRLFGFYTRGEKDLFEKLITVKGVGPKSGLTIVSGLPASQLINAISSSDVAALSRVPGIGKKTAERIILELRDKLVPAGTTTDNSDFSVKEGSLVGEVISALESLGFKKREAEMAAIKVIKANENSDVSSAIKAALKILNS